MMCWSPEKRGYVTLRTQRTNIWELLLKAIELTDRSQLSAAKDMLLKAARASVAHADESVRAGAIRVLSQFAVEESQDLILEATKDESSDVQKAAVDALAKLSPAEALPGLRRLSESESWTVRSAVAGPVTALGGEELRFVAETLLDDSDSDVHAAAMVTIEKYPDLAEKCVDRAAEFTDHENQVAVIDAMGALSPPDAAVSLGKLAHAAKDGDLCVKAVEKLVELVDDDSLSADAFEQAIVPLLEGDSPLRKRLAACVLSGVASPTGLPVLLELADRRQRRTA
jgi:HEAT repeat protein